jgi:hypothetical protein
LTRFNDEIDRRHPLLDAAWLDYPRHYPNKQQLYPGTESFLFQPPGVRDSPPEGKPPEGRHPEPKEPV